jgi:hypothetical protein
MPNTLAHIGLQTPLTKLGFTTAPLQWIVLGCIIPDIPWILQRILRLIPAIDPVDLRLYVIFQASLFSCCILSLAFALLTRKTGFIFLILSLNSLLHLLLDACQIKWGNGVNLLLPFSWHNTNFALIWPEHLITYLLMAIGGIVFITYWVQALKCDLFLQKPDTIKTICLVFTLVFYITGPFLFIEAAYNADVHYSKTLFNKGEQTGKSVEIDRGNYEQQPQTIDTYAAKALPLNNPPPVQSGIVSIKGIFDKKGHITVTKYHEHKSHRDYASYAGLFLVLLLWSQSIIRMIKKTSGRHNHAQR